MQADNDYMLDSLTGEGVCTLVLVLKWDTEYVVEEIECVASGDNIVATYSWLDPKTPWGNEQFEPVFEALIGHDLPLLLHGLFAYWSQHSYVGGEVLAWAGVLGFDWPVHTMVNIMNMIMRDVSDRYPGPSVVFRKGGRQRLLFLCYRTDEFYEMHSDDIRVIPRKYEDGEEYFDQHPSEYLCSSIYMTTRPLALPRGSGQARNLFELSMTEGMFIYSSDWPHQTLNPPT